MAGIWDLITGMQTAGAVPTVPSDDIVVQGAPRMPPERETIAPRSNPFENRGEAPTAEQMKKELLPRQGMFGTKGTLRDVIGVIGDTLLGGSGADLMYQPQREKEKQADALYGFTDDPMAAIERLAAQGHTKEALALYNQYQGDLQKNDEIAVRRQAAEAAQGTQAQKNYAVGARLLSQIDGAIAKYPAQAERLGQYREKIKEVYGIGDEYPDVTEEEVALAEALRMAGTPAQTQETLEQRQGIEEMKEKGRMARDNPPQPRAAPNPTAASMAAPLLKKLEEGGTLTPAQQEVLNRLGYSPDKGRGRGRGRGGDAPSNAGKYRFNPATGKLEKQ